MKNRFIVLLTVVLIIACIIILFLVLGIGNKPLPDNECAMAITVRVSDTEFGRSVSGFSSKSGIFPAVTIAKGSAECGKPIVVTLYDANRQIVLSHAYNSPPQGMGGTTGYGDYNPGRNLSPGSYYLECSYGDALVNQIQITIV
ncbi:MAG: hypothetical protein A4E35_01603 [Methanoregula sp. PtaU1.Bin051]|nr:MAG: hypothetical protein A4E35_01603 [Methanoregula sp. PtaU1.Bin051]